MAAIWWDTSYGRTGVLSPNGSRSYVRIQRHGLTCGLCRLRVLPDGVGRTAERVVRTPVQWIDRLIALLSREMPPIGPLNSSAAGGLVSVSSAVARCPSRRKNEARAARPRELTARKHRSMSDKRPPTPDGGERLTRTSERDLEAERAFIEAKMDLVRTDPNLTEVEKVQAIEELRRRLEVPPNP